MKKYNGFTLIELLIVVAIIGVIGAIAYPSYNSFMTKAKRSDAKVGLTKMSDRQERYYLQNNTYAASTTDLGVANPYVTDEGYYEIEVEAGADETGYVLTATAIAGQSNDADCLTLSLSSTGAKTANPDPDGKCW